jgi:hypothetical protein
VGHALPARMMIAKAVVVVVVAALNVDGEIVNWKWNTILSMMTK